MILQAASPDAALLDPPREVTLPTNGGRDSVASLPRNSRSGFEFGEKRFQLCDVEVGEHLSVHDDDGNVRLPGKFFHFFVRGGILSDINALEFELVLLEPGFCFLTPTAERFGI